MTKFREDPPEEEDDPAPKVEIAPICHGRENREKSCHGSCRGREKWENPCCGRGDLKSWQSILEGQQSAG
jgi:hypothetical protein